MLYPEDPELGCCLLCKYIITSGYLIAFLISSVGSCLKYYMEKWLKLLLEWDAAKRGRILNRNKELEIVVFDLIEDILSKKVCNFKFYLQSTLKISGF